MPLSEVQITTKVLWTGTLLFVVMDAILIPVLVWRIKPATFRSLKGELPITATAFWLGLWFWAVGYFWEPVYRYVFPRGSRWLVPFFQAVLAGLVVTLAQWVARRWRLHPVLTYCAIGGSWGMITHLWAVQLGIVDKPPMLQGALPAAAVVIAVFEFTFYWCLILIGAVLLHAGRQRIAGRLSRVLRSREG